MSTIDHGQRTRRPQYRHATVIPVSWAEQMLNPLGWRAGHWALFLATLTFIADIIVALFIFNFFGLGRQFEISMWLLIAGILGFAAITLALYAIVYNSGRGIGVGAFIIAFMVGAPAAWLVGNTVLQFILNGGTLPYAPIDW